MIEVLFIVLVLIFGASFYHEVRCAFIRTYFVANPWDPGLAQEMLRKFWVWPISKIAKEICVPSEMSIKGETPCPKTTSNI